MGDFITGYPGAESTMLSSVYAVQFINFSEKEIKEYISRRDKYA